MKLLLDVKNCSELFVDAFDLMPKDGKWSPPAGYYHASCSGGMLLTEDKPYPDGMWLTRFAKPSALVLKSLEPLTQRVKLLGFTVHRFGESYTISANFDWGINSVIAIVDNLEVLKHPKRKML